MSKNEEVAQKAIVLWLSGIELGEISAIPEVKMLMKSGAIVELDSSPITGPKAQNYQVFSGRSPASFGLLWSIRRELRNSLLCFRLSRSQIRHSSPGRQNMS